MIRVVLLVCLALVVTASAQHGRPATSAVSVNVGIADHYLHAWVTDYADYGVVQGDLIKLCPNIQFNEFHVCPNCLTHTEAVLFLESIRIIPSPNDSVFGSTIVFSGKTIDGGVINFKSQPHDGVCACQSNQVLAWNCTSQNQGFTCTSITDVDGCSSSHNMVTGELFEDSIHCGTPLSDVTSGSGIPTKTKDDVIFTFTNRCTQDLWIGAQGRSESMPKFVPNNGGWHLPEGTSSTLSVPFDFSAGRFWARTGCSTTNGIFHCETGDCGNRIECASGDIQRGGKPPASLAEFTLNSNNQDSFDISLVDGFNVPLQINVDTPNHQKTGDYWCKSPGCLFDINSICPADLTIKGSNGTVVACDSACTKWNTNEYCCRCPCCGTPSTCNPKKWKVNYAKDVFKDHCPQAYSYAYDDLTSSFACSNTNYTIFFC